MPGNSKSPTPSKSKSLTRLSPFGPPPLLEGEDSAAYDELLARVFAEEKPTGIVEEFWLRDVVDLTWEILRWRRLKISLVELAMTRALRGMLEPLMRRRAPKSEEATSFSLLPLPPRPTPPEDKLVRKWAARNPAAIKRVR